MWKLTSSSLLIPKARGPKFFSCHVNYTTCSNFKLSFEFSPFLKETRNIPAVGIANSSIKRREKKKTLFHKQHSPPFYQKKKGSERRIGFFFPVSLKAVSETKF
jgi:hypothetical protein